MRIAILVAALVLCVPAVTAQHLTNEGTEFWIGFMPNYDTPSQSIAIFVASEKANAITVQTYGDNARIVDTKQITLKAGATHRFDMSVLMSETRVQEKPVYKGIRVTSTSPCVVYGYSDNALTTDGYLALPITALGKQYYCVSYYDDYYWFVNNSHLGGEFLIVAPYDSTLVTITTTAKTRLTDDGKTIGHPAGDTWTVMLHKGQTYLVQSTGWEFGIEDLTGSHVRSNKPISFLSGHQRAQVGSIGDNSKDHLAEMLPPVEAWGTEYFVVPHKGRTKSGDYIRCLSAEDDNIISVNGSIDTLQAGDWIAVEEQIVSTVFKSVNGKKFIVMDYSYYQGYNGDPQQGDPHMITMIPREQFQKRVVFRTPQNAGSAFQHFVTIVYHKDFVGQIRMTKAGSAPQGLAAFASSGPKPFPGSDYVAELCRISGDEVTWTVQSPTPVGVYQYGFTDVESYGWPSGMRTRRLNGDTTAPTFTLTKIKTGEYRVRARDAGGIAEIRLLDSIAINYGQPRSTNMKLTMPARFVVGDTAVEATLLTNDLTLDGTASFLIIDLADNIASGSQPYTSPGLTLSAQAISLTATLGDTSCSSFFLKNTRTTMMNNVTVSLSTGALGLAVESPTSALAIAPGDSAEVVVCYSPLVEGSRTDSVRITLDGATYVVRVMALGIGIKLQALDLSFDTIVTSSTNVCKEVVLRNTSTVPLTVTGATSLTGRFTVVTSFPFTIGPNDSQLVTICHLPVELGAFRDSIAWHVDGVETNDKRWSVATIVVVPVQTVREELAQLIRVWPNPFTDRLFISTSGVYARTIEIRDILGRKVFRESLRENADHSFDTHLLPTGTYELAIETAYGTYTQRFVKQ